MLFHTLLFLAGIAALLKGANWFTEAAERLAHRYAISPYIIGVTVVSVGTSLPELASSIAAVLHGEAAIVAGNVIGSNIANSLLVLGAGAAIAGGLTTAWDLRKVDFPLLFGATFLLALMAWNGSFTRVEACFMLVGLAIYLHYLSRQRPVGPRPKRRTAWPRILLPLAGGGLLIYLGADWTVRGVIGAAALTGIPSGVIATTAVALGTSLPELLVTAMAALKGKQELAIGNVMGSNLFNILGIMGIAGLFGSIPVGPELLAFALPVLGGATFMLYTVTNDGRITRWEGLTLILLYAFFVVALFA